MSSIAAKLGGSKATLWAYFRTKEDLFGAVIDDLVDRYGDAINQPIRIEDKPEQTLRSLAADFMGTLLQPDIVSLQRLVTGEAERFPELGKLFYQRGPQRALEHLRDLFSELMRQGFLIQLDPMVAARHFVALCQSGGFQLAMWGLEATPSSHSLNKDIDAAIRTFLRGFAVKLPSN